MEAIIFDCESTGLTDPELIEAAWLPVDVNGEPIGDGFVGRYCPSKPITLGALATHHVMDEELRDAPLSFTFALPEGVAYMIGHNPDFDWTAIGKPDVKRICTCALSRRLWPSLDSHSLGALLYHIDRHGARERLRRAHSAAADVENCALLLKAILAEAGFTGWEPLWQLSELARIPTHMAFGKHKGTAIGDLPLDYRQWMLRQADMDAYLLKAVKQSMQKRAA